MTFNRYELNDNELNLVAGGTNSEFTEKLGIWYPFKNDASEKNVMGEALIPIP